MTTGSRLEELTGRGAVVTDGAWGTQLQARGLPIGGCPDAWNIEKPELVEDVARGYVAAGSQVIITNTFGANRFVLESHGLADRVAEVNRRGVEISRRAAGANVRVFASIGPSGKMLAAGDVTLDELEEAFAAQAEALAEGGADGLVVETMSDLDEAVAALRAARSTGLPVVVSVTFGAGRGGDRTLMGTTPEQAAAALTEAGADAVGTNCGLGPDRMLDIVRRLHSATSLPLWVKPNAGLPELVDGVAVYRTQPEEFAVSAASLIEAGASFIGGCCGTSPAFISAVVAGRKGA